MKRIWTTLNVDNLLKIGFIGLFLYFAWFFCGKWVYLAYLEKDQWKEKTIPLTQVTRDYLCQQFSIDDGDLCVSDEVVYGPDFYEYIRVFLDDGIGKYTEKDINDKLGPYLQECTSLVTSQDGFDYYTCLYDLAGDSVYLIGTNFYRDGTFFDYTSSAE